eukprot:g772.t1
MRTLYFVLCLALFSPTPAAATTAVTKGMKSIGVAIKQCKLQQGVEKTVFEHTLSPGASHGVMTEAWHAGKPSGVTPGLRVRYYVDGETTASIDYPLFLAHAQGPAQVGGTNKIGSDTIPWGNSLFGRTHDSGWYNTYIVPFQRSIKITLTDPVGSSLFWYMCRGVENLPIVIGGLQLPSTTRLQLQRTSTTVRPGTLVNLANSTGNPGIMRQTNMVVNSTRYDYEEGCMSARIDGEPLWLSSGLEDYFLGAYFHSMPTEHLPYSGFEVIEPAVNDNSTVTNNSMSAYRIHDPDPILFAKSLQLNWIASSDNVHHNGGFCNYDWPAAPMPASPKPIIPDPGAGEAITIDALTWTYVWDEASVQ